MASRGDNHGSTDGAIRWSASPFSSSSSSSSSPGPASSAPGEQRGRRLTPDTGSDDNASEDDEKDDEEQAMLSTEREPRGRRREPQFTPEEEQAVVHKLDRKLVVFVAVLYLLSFLDRSNIGNARVAGMDDDLQSVPPQDGWYEWALGAFYVAYIAFEWMALLWRVVPAHIYVAVLVFSWGVTASLQAVAVNYPMLIFLRFLLGIGEAGFTGVPFYLSFFFKRDELAFRTAIFVSAAPLATSFASSLAWLIVKFGESTPIAPWRLLFLIEGCPSLLVAGLAWHLIPDSPQTTRYLTAREKKVARLRLLQPNEQQAPATNSTATTTHPSSSSSSSLETTRAKSVRGTLAVVADPAALLTAFIFFLANMAYSSLPVFLPTILHAMGHSPLASQALSAPPYLLAFFTVLVTARASDAHRARAPFLIANALASAAGYTVLAFARSFGDGWGMAVRYLAVYPAAVGFFNVVVLTVAWSVNNQRGADSRRGAGFALLQAVGQCGPLVGTRLYPDRDAPYYTRGMAVCAGAMVGVAVLAAGLRWWLARWNCRWDRDEGLDQGLRGEEEQALVSGGNGRRRKEKGFRYML
ncbi:major facilitator superfamily domain-containing protein [Corynascus novoguineensis]|uniref:Major facilitator superfamily domain-containing protein n=1 Tax=Corynascus novoguineensis TaxID=1126955 RepID=A0AAN7CVH6_9PEZI|nr:major facilitator superfamily domain-containing protein [Corynascus novoguineensis]